MLSVSTDEVCGSEPKPLGFSFFQDGNAFRNGIAGFLAVFRIAGREYLWNNQDPRSRV